MENVQTYEQFKEYLKKEHIQFEFIEECGAERSFFLSYSWRTYPSRDIPCYEWPRSRLEEVLGLVRKVKRNETDSGENKHILDLIEDKCADSLRVQSLRTQRKT